jgi:hypothetical protein
MSAAEDGFLLAFEFDDDDRPLIVEDDGRVCYAYVRGPWDRVVSDVWLYNRTAVSSEAEWGDSDAWLYNRIKSPPAQLGAEPVGEHDGGDRYARLAELGAFANPSTHGRDWAEKPLPSYTEFSATRSKPLNGPTTFAVFIRGELFATLRMGEAIGRSKLAKKDGPLALRLPERGGVGWNVVAPYWGTVDIHGGEYLFLRTFAEVPEPVGHLLAVTWCRSEVCNGGFHQFFTNGTGVLAPEAARGFRAINMPAAAETVEEAMALFGTPYPRDDQQRQRFLSSFGGDADDDDEREWNPFCDLDDRFYAAIGDGLLDDAVDEYALRTVPEAGVIRMPEPQFQGSVCYVRLGSARPLAR